MSNGDSILDRITGLFASGGESVRRGRPESADPVERRLERVEQIASGVEKASAALAGDREELRRAARGVAGALVETARRLARERGAAAGGEGRGDVAGGGGAERELIEALGRCADALQELHFAVLRVEVHPETRTEEERERAARHAREAAERARELADSLGASSAA